MLPNTDFLPVRRPDGSRITHWSVPVTCLQARWWPRPIVIWLN